MIGFRNVKYTLTLAALLSLAGYAVPAMAQEADQPAAAPAVSDVSKKQESSSSSSSTTVKTSGPVAPTPPAMEMPKAPEPPKPTGPTYNPPPPSGKDWGKLPQESREQILNDWKALSEKDREPFIFYRERAMAKLPDSAYSDNPYKPDAPESAGGAAVKKEATSAATSSSSTTTTDEKSAAGSFFDKIMGKDDAKPAVE